MEIIFSTLIVIAFLLAVASLLDAFFGLFINGNSEQLHGSIGSFALSIMAMCSLIAVLRHFIQEG